jgi:LPS export ABC transporter protein LptC
MIMFRRSESAPRRATARRRRPVPVRIAAGVLAAVSLSFTPVNAASTDRERQQPDPEATELRATGMTFVGSRGDTSELVLHSGFATFYPDRDFAELEEVRAVVKDDADGDSFEMTCDRAELNIETNDFRAEGRVRGTTADGQSYSAPWVEYDHEAGLLRTDAPVKMVDGTGTFRGDGFRYHVQERKFKLLGNVSVEQR